MSSAQFSSSNPGWGLMPGALTHWKLKWGTSGTTVGSSPQGELGGGHGLLSKAELELAQRIGAGREEEGITGGSLR